jgi:biotin operon repressor
VIEKTLATWLANKRYDCFYNFPLGGKFPDLIAIKDKELIAFSLKRHVDEIPTAMGQCLFYLNDANKVFIVIPKEEENLVASSVIQTLKDQGIGLLSADSSIKILVDAKEFRRNNISIIEEIEKRKVIKGKEFKGKNDVKKRVIEILKEHPEGLTTVDISKYIGMSRHSVTKYIYQLLGEGSIYQREIGTAKLCYLKKYFKDSKVAK